MNLGLKGRVALVTGASKGIGKAIARGLADEGVSLVLLARTADALEAAAAEIRAATGVRVIAVPTDLRDATATKAAAARAATEFGTVHILVNNAGGPIKRPERQITWPDGDWLDDINTKTVGMLRITQALMPHMPTDGTGRIVNISGIAGSSVLTNALTHGLNNSAMNHVTSYLAADLSASRITVNAVMHRANIERIGEMVDLAILLGAGRVEVAHVQYYGWGLRNRAMLMPAREQVERALAMVEELRQRYHARIVIDAVVPDYFARYPKPCVGGWGRRSLNVTPSGRVLPCHAAESIPGLEFWSVRERSLADIWEHSPAFNAFRGTGWMSEPCASCARREQDFGGCRCQAFALLGDAAATDPVCHLSPHRAQVSALALVQDDAPYFYRHM